MKAKQTLVPELRFGEFRDKWKDTRLGSLAKTVTSGSRDWAQYYADEGSKFIRMTNLPRGGIQLLLNDLRYVKLPEASSEGKRTSLEAYDILISITAELGKIGLIPSNFGTAYINQHTALVRLDLNRSDAHFIAYKLSSKRMNNKINRLNDSGAKSGLNLSTIRSFPLSLPALPEQEQIAAFLTSVDDRIDQLKRKKTLLQDYKKGVMQKIFSQELRFKDDNGNDYPDWEDKKLGGVADCLDNLRKPVNATEREKMKGDIPYYGANGVQGYVNDFLFNEDLTLLAEDGGNFDEFANRPIAQRIIGKAWVNNHAHILRAKQSAITPAFLFHSLVHKDIRKYINGSSRAKLNKGDMLTILTVIPSLPEQTKIANFLSTLDQKIEQIDTQITQTQTFKKGLLQQMFV